MVSDQEISGTAASLIWFRQVLTPTNYPQQDYLTVKLFLASKYKRDAHDLRESSALDVVRGLRVKGALVYYTDPYVPSLEIDGSRIESVKLAPKTIESMDCLVVLTDPFRF